MKKTIPPFLFHMLALLLPLHAAVPSQLPPTAQTSPTNTSALSEQITPPPSQTLVIPWQPALSTTFTPPQGCASSLTMLEAQDCEIWNNEPVPVLNRTLSTCYPPAFMTSYIQSLNGNTLPPFSPLVCQEGWETVYSAYSQDSCSWSTSTACWYIACCPRYSPKKDDDRYYRHALTSREAITPLDSPARHLRLGTRSAADVLANSQLLSFNIMIIDLMSLIDP